jgi:hypothetical protein
MKNKALSPDNTGILSFPPKTVFVVYTRRSNSPKRLIHTGNNLETALTVYTSFKVFKGDFKYLFWVNGMVEHLIYRATSSQVRAPMKGKRNSISYNYKQVQCNTVPTSLISDLLKALKPFDGLTINNGVPYLIAHFCSLSYEERIILLANAKSQITRHVILSGGDNSKDVKDYLINEARTEELL